MSLKAYDDACTRAELFGQPLPKKEEFLAKNKHLDVTEFEEVEIKTAEVRMLNTFHVPKLKNSFIKTRRSIFIFIYFFSTLPCLMTQ